MIKAIRYKDNPLIYPEMDPSISRNINGPSLIKVPEWIKDPLGKYYLYFADHQGKYIRLAYSDKISGPYEIFAPGTLMLDQTPCFGHIASPDVHVDNDNKKIIMYYHAMSESDETKKKFPGIRQVSLYAFSEDGLHFESDREILATSYLRVFRREGLFYGISMPGYIFRSENGRNDFVQINKLFDENMRHCAVLVRNERIFVLYTDVGDDPEHIKYCELSGDKPSHWECINKKSLLYPQETYEGSDIAAKPSIRGYSPLPVRELRDPAVYEEDGRIYLLYTIRGEFGIALAELFF